MAYNAYLLLPMLLLWQLFSPFFPMIDSMFIGKLKPPGAPVKCPLHAILTMGMAWLSMTSLVTFLRLR